MLNIAGWANIGAWRGAYLRFWPQLMVPPGPYGSKSNMLQEHYLNAHCSKSIFATCSRSSVHFKYDPGAYLT